MPWWIPIVTGVAVGIILFFVLPALEPARRAFLTWIGIKSVKEQAIVNKQALQEPPPTPTPVAGPAVDPEMIYTAMDSAPSLQRDDAVKHFVSLKVDWTGTIKNMFRLHTGKIYINCSWKNNSIWTFVFEVDEHDYPGLGLLKEKDRIRVTGTIKQIEIPYPIRLKDVTLLEYGAVKR